MTGSTRGYEISAEAIAAGLGDCTPELVALLAQECVQRGVAEDALDLCRALNPDHTRPALSLCEAVALFRSDQLPAGLALLDRVIASGEGATLARYYKAQMLARGGQPKAAFQLLVELIDAFPDFPGAHAALANLVWPGLPYRSVLTRLHTILRPRTYLEIGVETGATLALAGGAELAVGVDPVDALKVELPAAARVYFEPSDQFFARSREEVYGDRRVDFTFIDGMHLFEYALRDFLHAERWSAPESTIILHDCLALTPQSATRDRQTKFWVGDTWKVLAVLQEYRPDLDIRAVLTPPSGLVVVRGLSPDSQLLQSELVAIEERFEDLAYPYVAGEIPPGLRAVPSSEQAIAQLFEGV